MERAIEKINEWINKNNEKTELDLSDLQLTILPDLPKNLKKINCSGNDLTSIDNLPDELEELDCRGNLNLISINNLPKKLRMLMCGKCDKLTNLPHLPQTLTHLDCSRNNINMLNLPEKLTHLYCDYNKLITLHNLPRNLTLLSCSNNQLSTLPDLPENLKNLYCDDNLLENLPVLPNELKMLKCSINKLTSLPDLPPNLKSLHCSQNQLTTLPNLPNSLQELICSGNQLTTLPNLPNSLEYLNCSNNLIEYLELNNNIFDFKIGNNKLTYSNVNYNVSDIELNKKIKYDFTINYININNYNNFYINNINKCLMNNTYSINYTNLDKWIKETIEYSETNSLDIQDFVYSFSKTLKHISFKTFYDNCCKLGYKISEFIEKLKNQNIVIFNLGGLSKSNNWILLLIWKFIYPSLTNKNNIYIIDDENDINKLINPIVIYIDDCGYSGNQIINVTEYMYNKKNIYIFSVYITDFALNKLKQNNLNVEYIELLPNFKNNLNSKEKLSYENVLNNKYLNKLWLLEHSEGITNIYFDHKLASGVSTFQSLIAFGLTPQGNSYPLISGCENIYTKDKIKYLNDGNYDLSKSLNDICPNAFYKTIKYTYDDNLYKKKLLT